MKVYCRFAPPSLSASAQPSTAAAAAVVTPLVIEASPARREGDVRQAKEEVRLHDPLTGSSARFTCDGVFLPNALSRASGALFTSDPLESSLPVDGEEVFRSEQENVYFHVCSGFLSVGNSTAQVSARPLSTAGPRGGGVRRNVLLAYGQTASGKTHTLFGSFVNQQKAERRSRRATPTSSALGASHDCSRWRSDTKWWEAQLHSPTAGLVPRFLADLFTAHGTLLTVDISCFEIYNEVATDLVALAAVEEKEATPGARRGNSGRRAAKPSSRPPPPLPHHVSLDGSVYSVVTPSLSFDAGFVDSSSEDESGEDSCPTCLGQGGKEDQITAKEVTGERCPPSSRRLPFPGKKPFPAHSAIASWQRYVREEAALSSRSAKATQTAETVTTVKTTFKSTEKGQVLGHLQRARCDSAVEAWVVLSQLLALRRRSATERNVSSSRGHLLIRIEARLREHCGGSGNVSGSLHDIQTASPSPCFSRVLSETLFCDLAGSESHRTFFAASDMQKAHLYRHGNSRRSVSSSMDNSSLCGSYSEHAEMDSICSDGGSALSQRSGRRQRTKASSSPFYVDKNESQLEAEAAVRAATRGQEMRSINASLLALRKVIHAFHLLSLPTSDGQQQRQSATGGIHTPFKDSTLTTILEPYLLPRASGAATAANRQSGTQRHSTVALVVCCSSRQMDFHETIASLRLGAEASSVKPQVVLQALPRLAQPSQEEMAKLERGSHRRSCSAPLSSRKPAAAAASRSGLQRAVATQTERVEAMDSSSDSVARMAAKVVALQNAVDTLSEEVKSHQRARLEEARATDKLTAQFAALCAHYKESVEALTAAKTRERERDCVIAELQKQLQTAHPCGGGAGQETPAAATAASVTLMGNGRKPGNAEGEHGNEPDTPWTAGKQVELSPCTTVASEDAGELEERHTIIAKGLAPQPSVVPSSPSSPLRLARAEARALGNRLRPKSAVVPPPPPSLSTSPVTLFAEVTNRQRDQAACAAKPASIFMSSNGVALRGSPEKEETVSKKDAVPTAAPCRVYKL